MVGTFAASNKKPELFDNIADHTIVIELYMKNYFVNASREIVKNALIQFTTQWIYLKQMHKTE